MEPRWHRTPTSPPNSQAEARWRPALQLPRLRVSDKSGGGMACRYRPRQACATHRWPPSGGFQCSFLSKDKLFNRLLFYEFTLRSVFQKRLRKILGLSRSTLRQNCSLKSCKVWARSSELTAETLSFSTMSDSYSSWHRRLSTGRRVWPLNYMLWCHHKQELQWEWGKNWYCGHPGAILRNIEKQMSGNIKKKAPFSSPEKCLFAVKFQKWTLTFEKG